MATLREVALAAGVSIGTVSNVINHPERVAPTRRLQVLDAIDELGFVPNSAAWHHRNSRRPILGFLSPNVSNPFFTEVAVGIEQAAFDAGYAMQLCHTGGSAEREVEQIRVLESQAVSAVVVTSLSESTDRLQRLNDRGIAVVMLGRAPRYQGICSVSVDDRRGGELAIEHVVALGHRRILWIAGEDSVPVVSERQVGFTSRFRELRRHDPALRLEIAITHGQATADDADAKISTMLLNNFDYTAVVCFNDHMALGVMRALTRVGIRIPDDVTVVGYDDIEYAGMSMVPLTTVRQPMRDLGRAAVELAVRELTNPEQHVHQHVQFDAKLIRRASSAPPPTPTS